MEFDKGRKILTLKTRTNTKDLEICILDIKIVYCDIESRHTIFFFLFLFLFFFFYLNFSYFCGIFKLCLFILDIF